MDTLTALNPTKIFFLHWSEIVSSDILTAFECVGFHETDLPFGRGGSPMQNLIARGYTETQVSAFRMTDEVDAGPIYLKKPLSLLGGGEEVFIRSSGIVADIIHEIIEKDLQPVPQVGDVVSFRRRKPQESRFPVGYSLNGVFDHIRMLDAAEYPPAFLEYSGYRFEFTRPTLRTDCIEANVKITEVCP
jgi:methionyl-tRNA formyltransferase